MITSESITNIRAKGDAQLIVRNELWDHESNHSGSYMPPQKNEYGSRAPSAYGAFDNYDQPRSRGISPAASYADLRPRSHFEPPQMAYNNYLMTGSPMSGMMPLAPDNRSFYGADTRSFYGGDNRSGSFYGQPVVENRASSYSLAGAGGPQGFDRGSSYGFPPDAGTRASTYYAAPQPVQSRPGSNFLPEMNIDTPPIGLGEAGITDNQLESSIRRICAGADLDMLTKKGVRKQLEDEYAVSFTARKDTINRIIERVLSGESPLITLCFRS